MDFPNPLPPRPPLSRGVEIWSVEAQQYLGHAVWMGQLHVVAGIDRLHDLEALHAG